MDLIMKVTFSENRVFGKHGSVVAHNCDSMHCKVTPVTFLGTGFHEILRNFHCLADNTAKYGVLHSFEWYTTLYS